MTKAIITVVGKDAVGIIAKVCTYLADNQVNILDITQTIVDGFFNMMMIVDVTDTQKTFEQVSNELYKIKPLVIWLYNPKYGAMHRDVLIIDQNYYNKVKPYIEHKYPLR